MIRFKLFSANLGTVVFRFYLLMAIVIIAGFTGQWWLAAFALPTLIFTMLAVKISFAPTTSRNTHSRRTTSVA